MPIAISIGKFLAKQTKPTEGFTFRLIERQKILQREKPEIAKILSGIMSKWEERLIDLEMINRIVNGKADAGTITGALARRKELKERALNEIYALRGKSGLASDIAACLLEDENNVVSAFHSENVETQIGTLACARLLRKSLPVREVGALLDAPNKLLALAAEHYLESEDSPEARQMVLARHKGEAMILVARTSFNPAKVSPTYDYNSPLSKLFSSGGRAFSFSSEFGELDEAEKNSARKRKSPKKIWRNIFNL